MDNIKKKLGLFAAYELIENNMNIGLGTGSTAKYFIEGLAERYHNEKLSILCVPSSLASEKLARSLKLPVVKNVNDIEHIDITIDGADEIDLKNNILIKGGGGALLREKMLASCSKKVVIIADETKFKNKLGSFGVPIAASPFNYTKIIHKIIHLGYHASLRADANNSPFSSDDGNYIIDIKTDPSALNPVELNEQLKNIPGILETGIFIKLATLALEGCENGNINLQKFNS